MRHPCNESAPLLTQARYPLAVTNTYQHTDDAGPNATANGTDSTTRLMSQLAEGASAAADVAAALPPSTRASASSLVQSAVKLASSFSPATAGRQQVGAPVSFITVSFEA